MNPNKTCEFSVPPLPCPAIPIDAFRVRKCHRIKPIIYAEPDSPLPQIYEKKQEMELNLRKP